MIVYFHVKTEGKKSNANRPCSLAYAEMRLILARVIYNFDMKLASESSGWLSQRSYMLWEKNPLMVYLTPRADKEKLAVWREAAASTGA